MTDEPVPDPQLCPTVTVEQAATWLGLGRSSAYEAARRGELPVLRFGRLLRVPTAALRIMLGLDPAFPGTDAEEPAEPLSPRPRPADDPRVVPIRPGAA